MHDQVSIRQNGKYFTGSRYLRREDAGVYQSIFYLGSSRSDGAAYSRFASDDECMNQAAKRMLTGMVDEAAARGKTIPVALW
jgi:hypothetical protein